MDNIIESIAVHKSSGEMHNMLINMTLNASMLRDDNNTIPSPYFNGLPPVRDLYAGLTVPVIVGISLAIPLFIAIYVIYFINLPKLLKNTPKQFLSRTIILCSVYPVVATAAVVSILVPRSLILMDTVCHLSFAILAYQFFCLCLAYTNGESNIVKVASEASVFHIRAPPCCCWMWFIQPTEVTKQKLGNLRIMIMQMPIVQGVILITLNTINAESPAAYDQILLYLAPFLAVSILTGVWGLQIFMRMIGPLFLEYKIKGKYFAIQFVLIFCKVQPLISMIVLLSANFDDQYPITPRVLANTLVQVIILIETVLLSLWAGSLYKSPSKDVQVDA